MLKEDKMTTELKEFVLERQGCPIHYWLGGDETAPWVIFLHGACVDYHSFDPILPVIGERYHVLAWDARGHGSSQPMGDAFTVPLAVEDLLALMDQLHIEQAVLVGHSNGTYIAQEFVFRHPERVRALVIADGTCITWEHSAFENYLVNHSAWMFNLYSYESLKRTSVKYVSTQKAVQDYTYAAYSRLSKENFIKLWTGISQCLHAEPGYTIPRPFLLTHGDDDRMGDIKKIAPKWAAREPNCQYGIIPNAGHFAVLDAPQFFNQMLLEFLAKWAA
jgi:Predicted hydrolases or acyltransferases (alpha/beta hydrolase superfamily)